MKSWSLECIQIHAQSIDMVESRVPIIETHRNTFLYDSENSFLRPPICVIPDALNMYISRKTKLAQFKIQNVVKDLTDFLIQTHFPGVLFSSDSCNSSKWIRQFQFKPIETVWCEIIFESVVLYFQQMIKLRVHPTTDTKVYSEVLIMQTPPPAPQHTHTNKIHKYKYIFIHICPYMIVYFHDKKHHLTCYYKWQKLASTSHVVVFVTFNGSCVF